MILMIPILEISWGFFLAQFVNLLYYHYSLKKNVYNVSDRWELLDLKGKFFIVFYVSTISLLIFNLLYLSITRSFTHRTFFLYGFIIFFCVVLSFKYILYKIFYILIFQNYINLAHTFEIVIYFWQIDILSVHYYTVTFLN